MQARALKKKDLQAVHEFLKSEPYYEEFIADDHYTKFVAETEGELAGLAAVSSQLGTAELNLILVDSSHHRKGIGTLLYHAVEAWAKEQKSAGIRVNCGQENVKAQTFYKKMGFTKTGEVLNYFSNKNTQIFFWKDLS